MISKNISRLKSYCQNYTKIENYDKAIADNENMWHCHHRLEIGSNGENVSHKDLKRSGLYFNRPTSELIFMLASEHNKLHNSGDKNPFYGKIHSCESKKKISETKKGRIFSEEHRKKLSDSHKGKQSSNKGRQMSEEQKKKISLAIKSYWEKKKIIQES